MIEFSRYYINFLRIFFSNIGRFFKRLFEAFTDLLYRDIVGYFEDLVNASHKFNFLDWIAEFIVLIINAAFLFFIGLRFYQFVRRYLKFSKREIEKEDLLDEIALLNSRNLELADEKNKILSVKTANINLGNEKDDGSSDAIKKGKSSGDTRFTKLASVDEKYRNKITSLAMNPDDMIGLPEMVERFVNFAASQLNLYYDKKSIRVFISGMATSKILILEGISGTGKTSLPYAMGKFFRNDTSIVSVQPSWRDRAEIIGYLNEFTKRFNETEFLKSVYEATYREDLNFIILDEMNLARIEYYFAEFLSILEMPNASEWKIDIVPDIWPNDPKNFEGGKLLVPQNLWFIGTANRDDSTFTITDKVYDRATAIEMNVRAEFIDAPFTESMTMSYDYLHQLFKNAENEYPIDPKTIEKLMRLDKFITENFKITFGNRILKQIKTFVPIFVASGGEELDALDYIVARKILRKFESLNISFLKKELNELMNVIEKVFGKNSFNESLKYVEDLLKNA